MLRETHRPTSVFSLAVLILVAIFSFGAGAAEAALAPSQHTKTVCDWTFVSGPRQGQAGKESRRFYGHLPFLSGTTYWAGGANDTTTYRLEYPSGLWNPPGTRWHVTVEAPAVTASLAVRQARHVYATTQRLTFFPVSNGAYVDCLELNRAALNWIRGVYGRGGKCDCAHQFDYSSTVGCIRSCAAHWNDDSKWLNGAAPSCLADSSIVAQTGCLLNNRWWDPVIDDDPDPEPFTGGDVGDPCGANDYCKLGLFCDASNICVRNEIP